MVNQKPSKPEVTSEERRYRKKHIPDITKEVKSKNALCTSCGTSVKDLVLKGTPISHPYLETLLCNKCNNFYGDGQFSEDEDGCDKYCRWCGQGGTLFLCSSCTAGFCKRCVKRNLPKEELQALDDDDWQCYCCKPKPIFGLRAQCWAAHEYAAIHENAKKSSGSSKSKSSKSKKKRTRDRDSSSDGDRGSKRKKDEDEEDDNNSDIVEEKHVKSSRNKRGGDSKKSQEKSKSENGGEENNRRNSLREPKKVVEEIICGVKITNWTKGIKNFEDVLMDVAKVTKEMHKKVLEYKVKKVNVKHINTDESFDEAEKHIEDMLVALSDTSLKIKDSMRTYSEQWRKDISLERGKAIESSELDGGSAVENGVANDSSDTNKMDLDCSKPSEDQDAEGNISEKPEDNSLSKEEPEEVSDLAQSEKTDEKMDTDSATENVKENAKLSPIKENGEGTTQEIVSSVTEKTEETLSESLESNETKKESEHVNDSNAPETKVANASTLDTETSSDVIEGES